METFGALAQGMAVALQPMNLVFALIGVFLGTAVGVLPGIGPALTVALLLPVTYKLDPAARSSCSPASTTAACMAARPPRS
jgi:putative tricarboxylic transport membrane protein